MSTQTPRRDNSRIDPRLSNEHSSSVYDDQTAPSGNLSYSSENPYRSFKPSDNSSISGNSTGSAVPRYEIGNQEATPSSTTNSAVTDQEQSFLDHLKGVEERARNQKGLYREEAAGKLGSIKGLVKNFTKAQIAASATALLIVGGFILVFSILQGSMQLIHLSQILQKSSMVHTQMSISRLNSLMRFDATGDVGETRVGIIGSKYFREARTELKNIGIEFERNPKTGHARVMTVDISKHPEFKNMSESQARTALASKYKVSPSQWTRVDGGNRLAIDIRDFGIQPTRDVVKTSLGSLADGRIVTGMQFRSLTKALNVPALYSPVDRAAADVDNKHATKKERQEKERERLGKKMPPASEKLTSARNVLKENLEGNRTKFSVGLNAIDAVCIVRAVSTVIPIINRGAVTNAVVEEEDRKAVGAQAQSGLKIGQTEAAGVSESLIDENGESVFQARAMGELSGKKKPSGPDIEDQDKQAFSNQTTTAKIRGYLDVPGAGIACSPGGQIAQTVIDIGLTVTGPGSWAVKLGSGAVGMAASSAALIMLQKNFTRLMADQSTMPSPLSGPRGGNVMAYAAREGANISGRSSGGVALDTAEEEAWRGPQEISAQNEFRSKSFAARIFDVRDHRTMAASVIQKTSLDPKVNAAKLANSFMNSGAIVDNFTSLLSPKVSAAEEKYQWDFPVYGIPPSVAEKYQDPYENANYVAANLLGGPEKETYIERAKKCFGVEVIEGADGWNVEPKDDVNPNDEEYASGNCDDRGDNWSRMMVFVYDTRLVNIVDCWDGNDEACGGLGINSEGAPPADSARTLVDGSSEELAQKLLDHKKDGKYNCDNPIDCEDLEMTVKGESIKGGVGCTASKLDIRVLKLLVYLIEVKDYKIGTYALCRSHSLNNGAHPKGQAVDISSINGTPLNGSAAKQEALAVDEIIFGLSGQLKARQIITGGVGNTRSVDADFVKFNRCGEGIEGQAAVDCFGSSTMAGHTEHIHVGY
jgi:hypothetical protein